MMLKLKLTFRYDNKDMKSHIHINAVALINTHTHHSINVVSLEAPKYITG